MTQRAFASQNPPSRGPRGPAVRALLLVASALLAAMAARAQDEFLLNDDRVQRNQWVPQAALGSTGSLVVAWMDGRNGSSSFVDFDIYAVTIRDPRGLGSALNRRLNDDGPGATQALPDISASPAGTFLCVWEDSRLGDRDVFAVALDSIGVALGPNLRLNDDPPGTDQSAPAVAALGADRYVVVWGDGSEQNGEVYASFRNAQGTALGPGLRISVDPVVGGSFQGEPALAVGPSDRILVAWLDGRAGGTVFGATFDVYGQFLDSVGQPVGGNFKINDATGVQKNASVSVAADPLGGFVVAWIDRRQSPADPGDVYAQRFDSSGLALGANVRVNDDAAGRDQRAVRAVSLDGQAMLVWEDLRGDLGLDSNVWASVLDYSAAPPGPNFIVNTSTPARQGTPGGVWDGIEAAIAVWEDSRNGSADIYAIAIRPDGTALGAESELNDDAAANEQIGAELGGGAGTHVATWLDNRLGRYDLYAQWITTSGARVGPNLLLWKNDAFLVPVTASSATAPSGPALVAAEIARPFDAGEIRGFLLPSEGSGATRSLWLSDSLPSAQTAPRVAGHASGFLAAWIDSREAQPRIYGQTVDLAGERIGSNHPVLIDEPIDPPFAFDVEDDPLGGYWLVYAEGASADQRLWLAHLDPGGAADRASVPVGPGLPGTRAHPTLDVGLDGRVEVAWVGLGPSGLGHAYIQSFTDSGAPLMEPLMVDASAGAQLGTSIAVEGDRSVLTWEGRQDGNWSVWLQVFASGVTPSSGVVRVDQDPSGADQRGPTAALDASGRALVVWVDSRSLSSGNDILGRVIHLATTAVRDPADPEREPDETADRPLRLSVGHPRPNPFRAVVAIPVSLANDVPTLRARVFDVRGVVVASLHDGPSAPGPTRLRWDGRDRRGWPAPSGVYWLVVEGGGDRRVERLALLR